MQKTISKVLSVILAVLMLAVSMPFAFASTPIALKASNVTEWPIAIGEIYVGQILGEHITFSGGEVRYDVNGDGSLSEDEIVPGKFTHWKPDSAASPASDTTKANLTFMPDDTTAYKGFNKLFSTDVTFKVKKTTPVLKDENDIPTATAIEEGQTLSASTISGGVMKNPYNDTIDLSSREWSWENPDTVVMDSGEYNAKWVGDAKSYETVIRSIYVEVLKDVAETSIEVVPNVPQLTYDGVTTWADVSLTGGIAVEKDTTTNVEGTFAIVDSWKEKVVEVGSYEVDAVFIPSDTSAYKEAEFKIPVTVNKGTVKFVDESGNEIVPEITLPYGFKVGDDLNGYLREFLNVSASFDYRETEDYGEKIAPGTHEYVVKTSPSNKNFEGTTLKFKVTVNQAELELKVKDVVGGKQIYIEGGDTYHLNGDFDVKYFIDGKETGTIEGVKFNETFEVKQDKSGVYTYEIIYNEAENDPYKVTKVTAIADDIKLQHNVKVNGGEPIVYTYGEMVTITAPAHEKTYYVFAGWANESGITLTDEQRSAESISTTMPDNDVELEATYKFDFWLLIKYIFDTICSWFAKIGAFVTGAFAA